MPEDTWLANDPDECQFIGYMLDGFPAYGKSILQKLVIQIEYLERD